MIAAVAVAEEERHWFLRNIARGFTDYLNVEWSPVRVEWILESPPPIYFDVYGRFARVSIMFPEIHDAQFGEALRSAQFPEFPLELHRFVIAREVLSIAAASEQGRLMGLPELLVQNLQ